MLTSASAILADRRDVSRRVSLEVAVSGRWSVRGSARERRLLLVALSLAFAVSVNGAHVSAPGSFGFACSFRRLQSRSAPYPLRKHGAGQCVHADVTTARCAPVSTKINYRVSQHD